MLLERRFIRNFSIIAHIDHGKSTLADRILEFTGAIDERHFQDQILDDMELERERGITIKASAVRLVYRHPQGQEYLLNLIDTPGHVDFTYEVSKSLGACEGAILLVDAAQGIEAQTIANFYLAKEKKLAIIPVINKIDLPSANVEGVTQQLCEILGFREEQILLASAKEGLGIEEILEAVVACVPPPAGDPDNPLQALIFDSTYNIFKGVMVFVRLFNGSFSHRSRIRFLASGKACEVEEIGVLKPQVTPVKSLSCGEVGYFTANIRNPREVIIGDTVVLEDDTKTAGLPGYKSIKPLVFSGIYPVNTKDFLSLREAMEKLWLNDASFVYEPENSLSFGPGFRCGFVGLLHMEIVQERLEREYDLDLVLTTPNVVYQVKKKSGETLEVDSPSKLPSAHEIASIQEPCILAFIVIPPTDQEGVITMAKARRGVFRKAEYLGSDRIRLEFIMPLQEVIVDFNDKIKSLTRGYGSLDYEFFDYQPTELIKLDILVNEQACDAFSFLVHKDKAQEKARQLVDKLAELIPRQLFVVNIQAAVGRQVIAAAKVRSLGKHVTGKCYGGDITRKRKLWEKQKKGKRRLKQFGQVQIPQEAFFAVLKLS